MSLDLVIYCETLDDAERSRIALANRIRAMGEKGLNDPLFHDLLARIEVQEKDATKGLQKAMRKHELGPWVKAQVGIGEKQAGRLLGSIGDVYIRPPVFDEEGNEIEPSRPRSVSELWSYCGYAVDTEGKAVRRKKGVQARYNPVAKMRAFLIAESCIKQAHSPYRAVYDEARLAWADRETSDGHKHNHALRVTAKEILKDMWIEARRIHQ